MSACPRLRLRFHNVFGNGWLAWEIPDIRPCQLSIFGMAEQQQFEEISSCVPGPDSAPFDDGAHFEGCYCCEASDCLSQRDSSDDLPACGCIREHGKVVNIDGRLREEIMLPPRGKTGPIFECGTHCSCDPATCRNRLPQAVGAEVLQVFPTQRKGLGVRATQLVPKGTFVCEYVGEVLKGAMAALRCSSLGESDSCYLMKFKEHFASGSVTLTTHVDATYKGNVARFINHSCAPNLVVFPVRSNSVVPRLCLFAKMDIAAGEELTYHYGESDPVKAGKPCHCGSDKCSGVLPRSCRQNNPLETTAGDIG